MIRLAWRTLVFAGACLLLVRCAYPAAEVAPLDERIPIVDGGCEWRLKTLTIGGLLFDGCMTININQGHVSFDIRGWDRFECQVGILNEGWGHASNVVVIAEADGDELWRQRIQDGEKPQKMSVPLSGKKSLTLRVRKDGSGVWFTVGFVETRLSKGPAAAGPVAGTLPSNSTSQDQGSTTESLAYWLKCPVCGTQFDKKSTLDEHIRSEHAGKASTAATQEWFTCPTCGIKYDTKDGLDAHIKSRHPANPKFSLDPTGLDRLAENMWKQCQTRPAIKDKVESGNVAVATFKVIGTMPGETPNSVAADTYTAMIKSGFSLVERGQLDKVLAELRVQDTALIDPATAAKIGKLSGADLMLLGEITDSDALVVINARLMETATGRSVAAERVELRKVFARS